MVLFLWSTRNTIVAQTSFTRYREEDEEDETGSTSQCCEGSTDAVFPE